MTFRTSTNNAGYPIPFYLIIQILKLYFYSISAYNKLTNLLNVFTINGDNRNEHYLILLYLYFKYDFTHLQ